MDTLIIKLGAAGDVVRTTSLLRSISGRVTWITSRDNLDILPTTRPELRCLAWDERENALDSRYSLLLNLEDDIEVARFVGRASAARLFGAFLDHGDTVLYTEDAREWFDMSLISRFGRKRADELKLLNRRSFQEMIFDGLGFGFRGERYVLPKARPTPLHGDVAIAPFAGPVWPMKAWNRYADLQRTLESFDLRVNVLPVRPSLLEHMGDISNHRCIVSGDSLPMHLALGLGIPCITIFNCTSPWEIHDYGLQTQIISPLLERFFYQRGLDPEATTAVPLEDVVDAVMRILGPCRPARERDDERSEPVAP